jgi:hypothetical protein
VSAGEQDVRLILGLDDHGEDRSCSLTWLINTVHQQTSIERLVVILDTCHAGRTQTVFRPLQDNAFAMFATGDAYAFDANFSDSLLRALEQPIRKNDQRIDRGAGGVTYQKLFEEARRRVLAMQAEAQQNPVCFGDLGKEVILAAPLIVTDEFNPFASSRSIYGRVFRLLEIIGELNPTIDGLRTAIRRDPIFLLQRSNDTSRYVSTERLTD